MLYSAVHWPKNGKVSDLLSGLRTYILRILIQSDVYLIFDRYRDFSIKSDTRQRRVNQFRCSHNLSLSSPLPAKEITLRVTKTKKQLTEIVKAFLLNNLPSIKNKLIITSQEDAPVQFHLRAHNFINICRRVPKFCICHVYLPDSAQHSLIQIHHM